MTRCLSRLCQLSGTGEYHVDRTYDDFEWLQQHLFSQEDVPGIQGVIVSTLFHLHAIRYMTYKLVRAGTCNNRSGRLVLEYVVCSVSEGRNQNVDSVELLTASFWKLVRCFMLSFFSNCLLVAPSVLNWECSEV